jgi:hypothetical protein
MQIRFSGSRCVREENQTPGFVEDRTTSWLFTATVAFHNPYNTLELLFSHSL